MDTEIQWEQNWPANQNVAFEIHDNNNNSIDDEGNTENGRIHAGIVLLGCYTRSTVAHDLYQWMLQQPLSTQDDNDDDDDAVAALERELYRLVVREDRNGHCWTIGQVRCANDDEPIVDPLAMERVGTRCSPGEGCCHYYLPSKYPQRKQPLEEEEPEPEETLEPPNLRKR